MHICCPLAGHCSLILFGYHYINAYNCRPGGHKDGVYSKHLAFYALLLLKIMRVPVYIGFSSSLCVLPSHFPSLPLSLTHGSHPGSLLSSTPSLTLRFRLTKARNPVQPAAGMSCLSCYVYVSACVCVSEVGEAGAAFWFWCVPLSESQAASCPCFPQTPGRNGEGKREQRRKIARKMASDGEREGRRWDPREKIARGDG